MKTVTTLEIVLLLESLAINRSARLNNIASERYLNGFGSLGDPEDFMEIQHDNICTDIEIRGYFLQRGNTLSPEVTELHLRACNESGVEFCICFAQKPSQGLGEPF